MSEHFEHTEPDRVQEWTRFNGTKSVEAYWTLADAEICATSGDKHIIIQDPTDPDYHPAVYMSDIDDFCTLLQSARKWLEEQR